MIVGIYVGWISYVIISQSIIIIECTYVYSATELDIHSEERFFQHVLRRLDVSFAFLSYLLIVLDIGLSSAKELLT